MSTLIRASWRAFSLRAAIPRQKAVGVASLTALRVAGQKRKRSRLLGYCLHYRRHASRQLSDIRDVDANDRLKIPNMETEKEIGGLLREVKDLHQAGNYQAALQLSLEMKDWLVHKIYASVLSNIALMYKLTNETEEAVFWYRRSLAAYKDIVGMNHRSYAATLNNLGLLFLAQGQQSAGKLDALTHLDSAEETLRKALEIRTAILQPDDPALATTHSNLASVLQRKGQSREAEAMLQSTLVRLVDKVGRQHEGVALTYNNLGYMYKQESRYVDAIESYTQALDIRRQLYADATHPQVIISMNNLAEALRTNGDVAEAEALQNEILTLLERRQGQVGSVDDSSTQP